MWNELWRHIGIAWGLTMMTIFLMGIRDSLRCFIGVNDLYRVRESIRRRVRVMGVVGVVLVGFWVVSNIYLSK
jgi:hypothetical protein